MSEPELPEGWPDAFDEEARDYLYEEASTRLREVIEFGNHNSTRDSPCCGFRSW